MTNEELIEKVARSINNVEAKWMAPTPQHVKYATAAIATILAELQEPTSEMIITGGNYVLSIGSIDCIHVDDRPEYGITGRETGSYALFKAMLAASPLVK